MTDFAYPLFPVFALLGAILPLVPLAWHLQAWNSGTCFYMLWASVICLNQFVNSILWHETAVDFAPVWCDISSRIIIAGTVGIPMASLCINRRLYQIARFQGVGISRDEKRRVVLVDSLLCIGAPIVQLIMYYCIQGHRYDIFEDIGCYPVVIYTIESIFLFQWWPIVIGLVSGVYCVLSLRALLQRQAQFSQFLNSNKGITVSRYVRLMALATTEILFTVPVASLALIINLQGGLAPSMTWEDLHFNFSRVGQYPSLHWRINHWNVVAFALTRWSGPFCSIVFFAFFGFAEEARRHYMDALRFVFSPFTPLIQRIARYAFPQQMSPLSTSTTAVSVEVNTSTCKFDNDKDLEKGLSTSKSLDGCDEVPFTPSSEPLPLYESHPSYARAL